MRYKFVGQYLDDIQIKLDNVRDGFVLTVYIVHSGNVTKALLKLCFIATCDMKQLLKFLL